MIVKLNLEAYPADYVIKEENGLIIARPTNPVKNWNHAISPDGIATCGGKTVYLSSIDKEKLGLR